MKSIRSASTILLRFIGTQVDTPESETQFKSALAIWDKNVGKPEDVKRAAILAGTGKLYRDEGRYKEAEKLYGQALAMKEKALGPNDLDIAAMLDNLGGVYRDEGRFTDSEKSYKRALLIYETVLARIIHM